MSNLCKILAMAMVLLMATSCKKEEEASAGSVGDKMMKDNMEKIEGYSKEKAEEFSSMYDEKMKDLDKEFEKAKQKISEMPDATKMTLEKQLTELEKKKDELMKKLEALGKETGDAWAKSMEDLTKSYQDLEKKFAEIKKATM